jgi:glycogen synthase
VRVLSVGNMYPPHHLGGYELVWRSGIRHLRALGHEVRVLTTDFRGEPAIPEQDPDVHRQLRWYWEDHAIPRRTVRERLRIERHNQSVLARHLEELRPHAVNWWAMGGMSMSLIEAVRRLGLPAVGVIHDEWMVYGRKLDGWQRAFGRSRLLARVAERATGVPTVLDLSRAARWMFVSERVRRSALDAGIELRRSCIAHSGIAGSLFPAAAERRWGWRLLYVGRLDPRKGIETAVRALPELPQARLEIVGRGDQRYLSRLRAIVEELGLGDRVAFAHRPHDQLAATYAAADAVLFPVLWQEPWGLVPLEAMSVGRPVIATGMGGSGEYLRDGENCALFEPPDSPGALAAAVRRVADDEALRARLREAGFVTAARHTEERFNSALADALAVVAR